MKKLIFLIAILASVSVQAQTTWMVDSLNDSGIGSLRAAADSCLAGDTIRFNPNLIANGSDSIVLSSGEIAFGNKSVVIIGVYNDQDSLYVSGGQSSPVLSFYGSGKVVLDSLCIRNGRSLWNGGGIDFSNLVDSVIILNSFFKNNVAFNGYGGAIYANSYSQNGNSNSLLFINNCVFMENQCNYHGGAIYSNSHSDQSSSLSGVILSNSEIVKNSTKLGEGGGVYCKSKSVSVDSLATNFSIVELRHCEVSHNISNNAGGGISVNSDNFSQYPSSASILIEYSNVSNNWSYWSGGAVYVKAFGASSPAETNSFVDINYSTISENRSVNGTAAGVYVYSRIKSTLNLVKSSVLSNHAKLWSGIWNYAEDSTTTNITSSTIYGNIADTLSAYGVESYGAGYSKINVASSIVAENGVGLSGIGNNYTPLLNSSGNNIFSDNPTGIIVSDSVNIHDSILNLTVLSNNGGVNKTMMPELGSVAIDNGDPNDSSDAQNIPIIGVRDVGAAEFCQKTYYTDSVYSCASYYTWMDGNTYIENDSTATFILTNSAGCDSVISLFLTLYSPPTIDIVHACDSIVWINGITYFPHHGEVTDTLTNSLGCDSVIFLNFIPSNFGRDRITSCDSLTWINGETYYTSNNTAKDTLVSVFGCDSVVTLDLTINYSSVFTDTILTCDSITWINGVVYSSNNNTASDTLINAAGCDSVVFLDLTILSSTSYIDVISTCDSLTWIDGITYSSNNNTASDTLINAAGCDSVVFLDLTILSSTSYVDVISTCDSLTWIDGVTYYTSNNTAKDTLLNTAGCDSIVTLGLTITNSTSFTDLITACDSLTWINGITYYSSNNTAKDTLINALGCDSIVFLDLTINHSSMAIDSIIAVNQYTWIDGVTYYTHNSTATYTLTNADGCDSLVSLYLEIQVVQIGVSQEGSTLTATADSGTFQWVECPNYDIIPGATDSVFNPIQNGSYSVIVTQNGYTDTSDCITVNNVGIGEVSLSNNINIYPNPVHDRVNIEITNWPSNGVKIVVRDITGKQVYTQNVEPISNTETININTSKWAKGTYFIEVGEGESRVVERIVVQ